MWNNTKKGVLLVSVVLLVFYPVKLFGETRQTPNLTILLDKEGTESVLRWDVGESSPLLCIVSRPKPASGPAESVLSIYRKSKGGYAKIYEYRPDASPISIFPTQDSGGRLITIWGSGSGYIIHSFAYQDKGIKQVLNTGSKWLPEFVLVNTRENTYKERILITELEWRKDPKTGLSDTFPKSAQVYQWNGKTYELIKTVPWQDRFAP